MKQAREHDYDYYEVLAVPRHVSRVDLIQAYNQAKLAFGSESLATYSLFDPDQSNFVSGTIERAFHVLMDSTKRREYDLWLQGKDSGQSVPTPSFIFQKRCVTVDAALLRKNSQKPVEGKGSSVGLEDKDLLRETHRAQTGLPPKKEKKVAKLPPFSPESEPIVCEILKKCPETNGQALQKIRQARGFNLAQIADYTKISVFTLSCIEEEKYSFLPPTPYLVGFLRQLAVCLGISPERVMNEYMEKAKACMVK